MPGGRGDAGVVHEDVDLAHLRPDAVDARLDVGALGHVAAHRRWPCGPAPGPPSRDRLGVGVLDVGDRDVGALPRHAEHDAPADPGARRRSPPPPCPRASSPSSPRVGLQRGHSIPGDVVRSRLGRIEPGQTFTCPPPLYSVSRRHDVMALRACPGHRSRPGGSLPPRGRLQPPGPGQLHAGHDDRAGDPSSGSDVLPARPPPGSATSW